MSAATEFCEPPDGASRIGIRANWTCAICQAKETTHQLAMLVPVKGASGAGVVLEPPPEWAVKDEQAFCAEHAPRWWRRGA